MNNQGDHFRNVNQGMPLSGVWNEICTPNADGASPVAQTVKNPPTRQETWIWCLGGEDPLEKRPASPPVVLSGEVHRQRSLAGSHGGHGVTWGPWGAKELSMTESLTLWLSFQDLLSDGMAAKSPCPLVPGLLMCFCCCCFLTLFWLILSSYTCWFFPWNSLPLDLFSCPLVLTLSNTLWMALPYCSSRVTPGIILHSITLCVFHNTHH